MLLQFAAQYIGQLTDIELRCVFLAPLPTRLPGGRRFRADRLVCIDEASASLAGTGEWGSR
jgi:hypothetical protein